MTVSISGKNIEVTDSIRDYIHKKVEAFEKFGEQLSRVDVEIDKNRHHKKGEIFHVRINVDVPHTLLHAEAMEVDLYAAIDVCRDHMDEQLRDVGVKKEDRKRRAQKTRRDWKSVLAFWK